ncbi:hypothetical protein BDA96_03G173900 [Sorghum bicolor]|uniref:Uncharacterized protein n=1 Tax=Sorghum bicolor TaxID=4558 RepID=A0A921UN27_SORBI|nr:hypothetical protein BDA96_03G173900 [Sorghum bicolor]KAG0537732.1 hypothetical protein BDA96_03G173900 [Sorghum bicolor]
MTTAMANHTNTTATATAAGSADHEPHHHHVHYHNIPSIQQGKLRSSSSHYPLSWHRIFFAQVHDMEVTREVEATRMKTTWPKNFDPLVGLLFLESVNMTHLYLSNYCVSKHLVL